MTWQEMTDGLAAVTIIVHNVIEPMRAMEYDELVKSIFLPAVLFSQENLPSLLELHKQGYYLSGQPAGMMVFLFEERKLMGIATLTDKYLYAVGYWADTTNFDKYLDKAKIVFTSFELV